MDWESLDVIKESTNHSDFELPKCLLSVDVRTKISLIKILNEDKVNNFFSSTEFWEYFDEEYLEDGIPGIYIAYCDVHSWQDNYPDSCEWNSELVIGEMRNKPIIMNKGENVVGNITFNPHDDTLILKKIEDLTKRIEELEKINKT